MPVGVPEDLCLKNVMIKMEDSEQLIQRDRATAKYEAVFA